MSSSIALKEDGPEDDLYETLRREERKWRRIVKESSHYQKRIRQPKVNLSEHPFCEGKRLRQTREELRRNRNPQLFETKHTQWYKETMAKKAIKNQTKPTRGPTQGILRQSFGHRPSSASRHFDVLSMSVKRHPRNDSSGEAVVLPRVGAISSSQLYSIIGCGSTTKKKKPVKKITSRKGKDSSDLTDEQILVRSTKLLDSQKSRIDRPGMFDREVSWKEAGPAIDFQNRKAPNCVNAVLPGSTSIDIDRRQALKYLARVSAGVPDFHPFCFDRQLEDEWRLVNLHEEELHGKDSKHRIFLKGSVIHSASPRDAPFKDSEVKRMFEAYRARKLKTGEM